MHQYFLINDYIELFFAQSNYQLILIFQRNDVFYPASNAVLQTAANSSKNTVIRRYQTENPALRPVIRVTVERGEIL